MRDWIAFHIHHVHYNFEYLGQNWNQPPFPWHVALVTTLFTVPVATLAAAAVGAVHLAGRARAGKSGAAGAGAGAAAGAVGRGVDGRLPAASTPIFGAEKHWVPALPTFCILAGVGIVAAGDRICRYLVGRGWMPEAGGFAGAAAALASDRWSRARR